MAKQKGRQFKVKFGDVKFGARAASTKLTFAIDEKNPAKHVGECWSEYRNRRLVGRIILGDDMPDQASFASERAIITGLFDTHKPSFSDDDVSLNITFDASEIDPAKLIEFRHKTGWIQIDSIEEIPAPEKKSGPATLWNGKAINELGIDDRLVKKMDSGGIKTIGELVDVFLGKHEQSFESMKVPKGRIGSVRQKVELFFEDQGVDSPLEELAV